MIMQVSMKHLEAMNDSGNLQSKQTRIMETAYYHFAWIVGRCELSSKLSIAVHCCATFCVEGLFLE